MKLVFKNISIFMACVLLFIVCACDSKVEENTNKESQLATELIVATESVIDDLEFVSKYVGNVNSQGKRAFADEFINRLRDALLNFNMNDIKESMPELADDVAEVANTNKTISDLLLDMGRTNSDENVLTIKTLANDNLIKANNLLEKLYVYV